MNRQQYLGELERLLSAAPEHVRQQWMYDYEEHFRLAEEEGKSEYEVVLELGDPRMIANELLSSRQAVSLGTGEPGGSAPRMVLAAVSLILFNLVFIVGPYIALCSVIAALWAVVLALLVSAVAAAAAGFAGIDLEIIQGISAALVCLGLGMLAGAGVQWLSRMFVKLTVQYVRLNFRLVRGK
ncbi:HAAS signaling domain-containing protein [Paenibacillus sp. y28]|uniref:HAAS signaling domain-containing protein n=1 Tax=Paenibacillus sp. y28 TaxID=3129110 RepID=UPI003018F57F